MRADTGLAALARAALIVLVVVAAASGCARRGEPELPGQGPPTDNFAPEDFLGPEVPEPPAEPDRPFFLDPLVL